MVIVQWGRMAFGEVVVVGIVNGLGWSFRMAYYIKREKVTAFRSVFEEILSAFSEGRVLRWRSRDMSRDYYRLREALACAEAFPDMFDGRFAALREAVRIRRDFSISSIIIEPAGSFQAMDIEAIEPDMDDPLIKKIKQIADEQEEKERQKPRTIADILRDRRESG